MSDRLTLVRALEESGMQSTAADRIATEIYDAIHDNVATKSDLRELESRLETKIAKVANDLTWRMLGIVGLLNAALFAALRIVK